MFFDTIFHGMGIPFSRAIIINVFAHHKTTIPWKIDCPQCKPRSLEQCTPYTTLRCMCDGSDKQTNRAGTWNVIGGDRTCLWFLNLIASGPCRGRVCLARSFRTAHSWLWPYLCCAMLPNGCHRRRHIAIECIHLRSKSINNAWNLFGRSEKQRKRV